MLLFTGSLVGQSVVVSVDITDASCQSNGAVTVQVSGGTGDYRYQLSDACGGNYPPQSSPTFMTLGPCDYTIEVEDRQSGETGILNFTIVSTSSPLSVEVVFVDCDASISISGGSGPFDVMYTTPVGTVDTSTDETVIDLPLLGDGSVSGTVVDACGNSRGFSASGTINAIQDFSQEQTVGGLVITPSGGIAPYEFQLVSSAGTFTNNDGVFPWVEVGCSPMLTIRSACLGGPIVDAEIELDLEMEWGCVNFSAGYAEVISSPPGRGPFTYEIEADGQVFTQTDSVFTTLPVNAELYSARVTDACGQTTDFNISMTRYQVDLLGEAVSCTDTEIAIKVDRQCSGSLYAPLTLTCMSCPDGSANVQNERIVDTTFFSGQQLGSWDIVIRDNCGDSLRCRDRLVLEAIPACDSIVANLAQVLSCDNGTFSRREVIDASVVYSLEDLAGTVIESNNLTGSFGGITPGDYVVRATSDCGDFSVTTSVSSGSPINPFFDVIPLLAPDENGTCQMSYSFRLEQSGGPYVVTGGPDGSFYAVFNDFEQDNCAFFENQTRLLPGDYTITSFSECGSFNFSLPEVVEPRIDSVAILGSCPGDSFIEIFGEYRTNRDYREWWASQGISIGTSADLGDFYYINETVYREPIIRGLPPGRHTVSIVPRFRENFCPIDTFSFVIPEYEPVQLETTGDILCDTTGSVPLRLFPSRGNGPYVLRQVDCADPSSILNVFPLEIGEAAEVQVNAVGTYCFVVEDLCGITADFQVEVRGINGNISVDYDCTPALVMTTDTLPGSFRWLAENGDLLGTATSLTLPPPAIDTEYTLEVDIGTCVLRETVPVAARIVSPVLDILSPVSREVVQCDQDTVVLIARTDSLSSITWDGQFQVDTLITTLNGLRSVIATNDLGCETTSEVFIRRMQSPNPTIAPAPNFCFGDTLRLGIADNGLAAIDWSTGALDIDSILISGTGFYSVSVTDTAGCSALDTFTFIEPGPLDFELEIAPISCFAAADASINVLNLSGGTPGYFFSLNDNAFSPGDEISNLDIGEYLFTVRDIHNCRLDTTFTLSQPDSLSVYIGGPQQVELATEVAIPVITNADTLIGLEWSTINPLEQVSNRLFRINALTTEEVGLTITDGNGCLATNAFSLVVNRANVYASTAFSPNGDGINDRFTIQGDQDKISLVDRLEIFDRWGNQHFGATNLAVNDSTVGWDGELNGRPAAAGVYLWFAEVTLVNGERRLLQGSLTLLR